MPDQSTEHFKRVNVLVRPEQHKRVMSAGLNMSGLIRGLLDDHFSEEKIVLSVSPRVKAVYQMLISNLGAEDKELEVYFLEALDKFLADKNRQIDDLRKSIKRE
jgi:esterase/lipase